MKNMKKMISLLTALIMSVTLLVPASVAAEGVVTVYNETFAGNQLNDSSAISLQYEPAGFTGINSESLYLTSKVGTALTGDFEDVTEGTVQFTTSITNISSIGVNGTAKQTDVFHIGPDADTGIDVAFRHEQAGSWSNNMYARWYLGNSTSGTELFKSGIEPGYTVRPANVADSGAVYLEGYDLTVDIDIANQKAYITIFEKAKDVDKNDISATKIDKYEVSYPYSSVGLVKVYNTERNPVSGQSESSMVYVKPVKVTATGITPVSYNVAVADGIENGTVSVDKNTAVAGDKVTVTAIPADGYELSEVVVMKGETAVAVEDDGTFTMPIGDVTVSAVFEKIPEIIDEGNLLFNETFAGGVMNDSHSSIALQYEPAGFTGINSESLYLTSKVGTALTGDFEDVTEGTIQFTTSITNINSIGVNGTAKQTDVFHIGPDADTGIDVAFRHEQAGYNSTNMYAKWYLGNSMSGTELYKTGIDPHYLARPANSTDSGSVYLQGYDLTVDIDIANQKAYITIFERAKDADKNDISATKIDKYEVSYPYSSVGLVKVYNTERNPVSGQGESSMVYVKPVKVTSTSIPTPVSYNVTVDDGIENGTVSVDKNTAVEGDVVTVTAIPTEGYVLSKIVVMKGETAVAVEADGTFTMPIGDVNVSAVFEKIPEIIAGENILFNETFAGGVTNDRNSSIALQYEPAGFTGINSESLYLTSKVGTALTGDFEDVTEGTVQFTTSITNISSIGVNGTAKQTDVFHIGPDADTGIDVAFRHEQAGYNSTNMYAKWYLGNSMSGTELYKTGIDPYYLARPANSLDSGSVYLQGYDLTVDIDIANQKAYITIFEKAKDADKNDISATKIDKYEVSYPYSSVGLVKVYNTERNPVSGQGESSMVYVNPVKVTCNYPACSVISSGFKAADGITDATMASGTQAQAVYTIRNNNDTNPLNATAIIAVYDKETSSLLAVKFVETPVTVAAGKTETIASGVITVPESGEVIVKGFLWEGLTTLVPLVDIPLCFNN